MSWLKPFSRLGGKRLTFLYVPDDAAVRQFRIPRAAFHLLAAVFVVGLGLIAYFGRIYISAAAEGREMLRLQSENQAFRERLSQLDEHLAHLEGEMQASQEIQQRLRLLDNLDPMTSEVLQAGVGGPSVVPGSDDLLPADLQQDLKTTGAQLSLLLRKARMQRDGYREILQIVENNQNDWDRTPSVRPITAGFISSRFGRRMDPFTGQAAMHKGIDFAARLGDPIHVTAKGRVTRASRWGSYGLLVEVDHGDGLKTRYAHCSKILVKRGQRVERGDVIARVGSTGKSTASHCHYEVIRAGMHQDPMKFLLPSGIVVD